MQPVSFLSHLLQSLLVPDHTTPAGKENEAQLPEAKALLDSEPPLHSVEDEDMASILGLGPRLSTVVAEAPASDLGGLDFTLVSLNWRENSIFFSTLQQLAEAGDVQSAASVYCVFHRELSSLVPEERGAIWIMQYLDLLRRLRCFSLAVRFAKECPLPSVQDHFRVRIQNLRCSF